MAHARFSAPEAVLALPAPADGFPYVRGHWHYARGVAFARLGRAAEAEAEAAAIEELARSPEIAALPDGGVPGPDVLAIAQRVVGARVAQRSGDHARAAALFAEAAEIQDRLPYMEPPFWYYPVHQSLGAALLSLRAGRRRRRPPSARRSSGRRTTAGRPRACCAPPRRRGDAAGAAQARALLAKNWFGGEAPALDRL